MLTIEIQKNARSFIKNLKAGDCVFNAHDTAEQKSYTGMSWIDYWKYMTGKDLPKFCPFCKKPLNAEDANGCHIMIPQGIELQLGIKAEDKVCRPMYIIPGHHKCNFQDGIIKIKFPIEVCLAIHREI